MPELYEGLSLSRFYEQRRRRIVRQQRLVRFGVALGAGLLVLLGAYLSHI